VLFFYGFLFISLGDVFWDGLKCYRKKALVIGIISFICYLSIIADWVLPNDEFFINIFKMLNLGSWIVVVFGYGAKYFSKLGKWLTYANQAVYPFYIFHQTIIVLIAYFLYDYAFNDLLRFFILVVGTFIGCLVGFEIVKRFKITRLLFGVKG
jgi:peptidoglycan/LPS O-acetylase OafA/YrhL